MCVRKLLRNVKYYLLPILFSFCREKIKDWLITLSYRTIKELKWSKKCRQTKINKLYIRKGFVQDFSKFTGKQLSLSLSFNEVVSWRPAAFLKKEPGTSRFLLIFQPFQERLFCRPSVTGCVRIILLYFLTHFSKVFHF